MRSLVDVDVICDLIIKAKDDKIMEVRMDDCFDAFYRFRNVNRFRRIAVCQTIQFEFIQSTSSIQPFRWRFSRAIQ